MMMQNCFTAVSLSRFMEFLTEIKQMNKTFFNIDKILMLMSPQTPKMTFCSKVSSYEP